MTHAALSALIGPEFDAFLCAAIGEDRNGTTLSVLSALARLDVDPWREATKLARMPREAAAERLSALIEALPGEPLTGVLSRTSAANLVSLLPTEKTPFVRVSDSGAASMSFQRTSMLIGAGAFVLMMLFVLAISTHYSPGSENGPYLSEPRGADSTMGAPPKPGP